MMNCNSWSECKSEGFFFPIKPRHGISEYMIGVFESMMTM